jgi:hypothetical protein
MNSIWDKSEDQLNLEIHKGKNAAFILVLIGGIIAGFMLLAEIIGK